MVRLDARTGQLAGSVRVKADGPLDLAPAASGWPIAWRARCAGWTWPRRRWWTQPRSALAPPASPPPASSCGPRSPTREWCARCRSRPVFPVPASTPERPEALALSADSVWVTDTEREALIRIDRDSGDPEGEPLPVGEDPVGLAVVGSTVWVTSAVEDTVTRVEAR